MSEASPYRRPDPALGSRPVNCANCGVELDARQSVLILADETLPSRLYCVRPECAQAFVEAQPLDSQLRNRTGIDP